MEGKHIPALLVSDLLLDPKSSPLVQDVHPHRALQSLLCSSRVWPGGFGIVGEQISERFLTLSAAEGLVCERGATESLFAGENSKAQLSTNPQTSIQNLIFPPLCQCAAALPGADKRG